MHTEQTALVIINVLGGILVIASYVHGIRSHPSTRNDAWGNVPVKIKPLYISSMFSAAAGYLLFTYFILFRIDPDEAKIANDIDFSIFIAAYCFILFPSAIWMPLTFRMLDKPDYMLWQAIRVTLAVVGLASIGLLVSLLLLDPREPTLYYGLAVAGAVFFCIQTALLDSILWPVFFPVKKLLYGRKPGS